MKTFLLIVLVIYPNSYNNVWAQTANNDTTTQLSGNTERLTQEMTQTPKNDSRTEYETNIQNFESKNTSSDTTTVSELSIEMTEYTTKSIYTETTTNSPTEQESQTQFFDYGNSSSLQAMNNFKDFILSTTFDSILERNQSNNNTNSSSNANQFSTKTSKSLNSMNTETNDETFNNNSDHELQSGVNNEEITIIMTPNTTTSSANESSAINSYDNTKTITNTNSIPNWSQIWNWTPTTVPNSQLIINSSPPMIDTTQLYEINSRQTGETSTHKTSAQTTQGIQNTTINTFIESNSRPNTRESAQITEIPINSTESQSLPNDYHILSALLTRDKPMDQKETNQTYDISSTQIPLNSNSFVSEISNTSQKESGVFFYTPFTETPLPNTISTSEISNIMTLLGIMPTNKSKEMEITKTLPQNETVRPNIESIIPSNQSIRLTSESNNWNQSEPIQTMQTRLSTDLPEYSSTEIPKSEEWTQFQNHFTQTMSSMEGMVNENYATQTTQSIKTQTEYQMTESSVGVLDSNDSQIIIKQPLTDRSLQTTQYIKPITTSIPLESNISTKTVILPNIKYIESISKEDMINIVTITFISKSLDIFRWVSIYDEMFRNFTCNRIDTERDWCTIDRFVYLSPSPLVINNHLICNFFIDDSTDNDLNNYHVFGGHLIVESLKNSTNELETMMGMKVMSLQTNLGTMVVKPIPDNSPEKMAKFELLVFIFTVVMFICTVLLCLAIICSCIKRKSVDMNQIQLSNCGRRQIINGGFDLNSASNILRDENQEKPLNHNVITLDGWVAPIEQVECQKISKYDNNLENTKL